MEKSDSLQMDVQLQRAYYTRTAQRYDAMHLHENDEHFQALGWLSSLLDAYGYEEILDIGSGTGRVLTELKASHPTLQVLGIEPVDELRAVGFAKGLEVNELIAGDATALEFADDSFSVVCEFGALHHIRESDKAVAEMVRVARDGVFLSDLNNFGHGSLLARRTKQLLNACGLWRVADLIKTRGKGYYFSDGDGVAYSYSVFNSIERIARKFPRVQYMSLVPTPSANLYRDCQNVAVFARR